MENLLCEIWKKVKKSCDDYLFESLNYKPAMKEFGLRFLKLAINDPNIYKFIFFYSVEDGTIKERTSEDLVKNYKTIFDTIINPMNISVENHR